MFRLIGVFLIALSIGGEVRAQTIDWEVLNRFRVIFGEAPNNHYISSLFRLRGAKQYSPPILRKDGDQTIGSALNYRTAWDERHEQYSLRWIHHKNRQARVTLSGLNSSASCTWFLNDAVLAGNSCGARLFDVQLGQPVKISVEMRAKGAPAKKIETTIEPRDILIALIGDSLGSGEGNPHLPLDKKVTAFPAIWWDVRCHRSLMSGSAQAAALLAERNKKQSVTFISYACSGAEIYDGVLTEYAGRETIFQAGNLWEQYGQPATQPSTTRPDGSSKPFSHKLRPQLDRLEESQCPPLPGTEFNPSTSCQADERRLPDILIVAVGGNDIAFGELGRDLLLSNPSGDPKKWREQAEAKVKPLLANLATDFGKLSDAVRERIKPKRVFLLEYIDPTRFSIKPGNDRICGQGVNRFDRFATRYKERVKTNDQLLLSSPLNHSLYNLMLTEGEGAFAHWVVEQLNGEIRKASDNLDWTSGEKARSIRLQNLKGPDGLYRGICAANSWFIGIIESLNRLDWIPEDKNIKYPIKLTKPPACVDPPVNGKCMVNAGGVTSGILHPNFFGHYNAGRAILLDLEASLASKSP